MLNKNIKLGGLSFLVVAFVFLLSGCDKKNEEQKNNQTQAQTQERAQDGERAQAMEQKRDGSGESRNGAKGGTPPAEMTEACSGKVEGDSCEVTMPARNEEDEARTMTGSCKKSGQTEVLSCMPTNMPEGGMKGE
ncbi:MAG: hypothetical protein RBR97_16595 [Bacteroidales bacterium]|jgi:hypothetical protein|nr:hypothetical protein [Bacteroidales bacterium]